MPAAATRTSTSPGLQLRVGHVLDLQHLRLARLGDHDSAHSAAVVCRAGDRRVATRRLFPTWPAYSRRSWPPPVPHLAAQPHSARRGRRDRVLTTGRVVCSCAGPIAATGDRPVDASPRVPLTEAEVVAVARHGAGVELTAEALAAIAASRAIVDGLAGDVEPHYGISTGFGALATKHIPAEQRAQLQRSLIRSHAAGSGPEVEREVVRALMLLRLSTLATGRTGVRPETAAALAALLDAGITPVVPEFGSLGCSGDLAPLAHVALALTGRGARSATRPERWCPAAEALAGAGIEPVTLAEKEGLALINGTDGMLGQLLLACTDLDLLLRTADLTAAMSVEAMLGTAAGLRRRPAGAAPAARAGGRGGEHARAAGRLADHRLARRPGLRLRPGRLLDALRAAGRRRRTGHARARAPGRRLRARLRRRQPGRHPRRTGRVERQLPRRAGRVRPGLPGDPGRRRRVDERAADGPDARRRALPRPAAVPRRRPRRRLRAHDRAVHAGRAGLGAKRLAVPASVDSIPSSAMQEDHVSMGWSAARKLRRSVDALTRVLAIELLTAARALDLRAPLRPGPATGAVVAGAARARRRPRARPLPGPGDRGRRRVRPHRRRRARCGVRARRPARLARDRVSVRSW